MSDRVSDAPAFLSTLPANRGQVRLAWAVVLVSCLVFAAVAPFAKRPLQPVFGFIPVYQSALIINDLVTAALLLGQFTIVRSKAVLVLAGGYLFAAVMAALHMLTFPGLFAPGGLLGANAQSTAWLYMFWHAGFPLAVLAYAAFKPLAGMASRPVPWLVGCILIAITLAAAFAALATAGQSALPAIMQGNRYTPTMIFVVTSVWLLSLAALLVLWRGRGRGRERTVLDVWLMVAMVAWLFDIALAAVLNAGRFDLGFYAGRIYGLLAASFVLLVLLLENAALYGQLAQAHGRERQKSAELERANARLEAADRFKSEFLANMAHELRTPLNAIIGFSELLKDGAAGHLLDKQRRFCTMIHDGGEHLLALVNDVLDLSKVEAGRMTLEPQALELDSLLEDCLAMFDEPGRRRGLQLRSQLDVSARMQVDPRKLRQIVYNLLSNAVKFTPDGGSVELVARRVRREAVDQWQPGLPARVLPLPADEGEGEGEGDLLEIHVRDSGPGLQADELPRLFEAFHQARTVQAEDVPGTGLGLALVSRLAALHGGTVGVASAPGRGSLFTVWIPWREADAAVDGAEPPLPAPPVSATRRALVIEDDPHAAELLRTHLEGAGFAVRCMADGNDLVLAADPVPDLIALDILLPGTNGWEVLEQLKRHPVLSAVPVVIVSVVADEQKGMALGAAKVLQKPLTRQVLLDAIDALDARRSTGAPDPDRFLMEVDRALRAANP